MVGGVIMVVRSGVTSRFLVERLLRDVPNVVGVVLNDYAIRALPSYYTAYGPAEMEGAATA
jgi:hypothetical protein